MVLLDKFFDLFCDHTAVINDDPNALEKDVEVIQKDAGRWTKVKGFTDFTQLFTALHLADAKRCSFSVAYIQSNAQKAGCLVLKKTAPNIKTIEYSDTQNLLTILPEHR